MTGTPAQTGKTALVTGSTSGTGLAIAKHLGAAGANLVLNGLGTAEDSEHVSPVEDFPADRWDDIIAVNLSSVFHAVRCALPAMKRSGWGRIINIASAHALVASPYKTAYVSAKHGVDEVAALALYLCNDAAASITGAVLSIDGAWTAK